MSRFCTILALGLAGTLAGGPAVAEGAPAAPPTGTRVSMNFDGAGGSITIESPEATASPRDAVVPEDVGAEDVDGPPAVAPPSPARSVGSASASLSVAADPFTPDIYPSYPDAARGLGEQWAVKAAESWAKPPAKVRVYCCDTAIFVAIRDGIRSRLPDVAVHKAPARECPDGFHEGDPADDEVWVLLPPAGPDEPGGVVHNAPSKARKSEGAQTLSLAAKGASDVAATTRYVDKPWVANFAEYTHRNRGRWVVGRSDPMKPAMSQAEAAEAASRDAADELFRVVRARVQRAGPSSPPDDWIRRQLEAKLAGGRLVVDRFPQKFERPYRTLWREAVLVNASDRAVDQLVGEITQGRAQERQTWLMTVGSAAGVLLVIYTLYRLANAFTRGYFVWSLRTAAAVAATAVVVLVRMIA